MSIIYKLIFSALIIVCCFLIARTIKKAIDKRRLKALKDDVDGLRDTVENALSEISKKFNYGHYITESERLEIDNQYKDLLKEIEPIIGSKYFEELEESGEDIESFQRLYKALSDTKGFKKINNEKFVEGQLTQYNGYFNTVLAYPLDAQQREAIVSLEDNVLVISSAGSGKTMTTVGKVRYLIDVQGVDPDKILLITFTRKAAASLSERLGEKDLRCVTFHKLALDIIAEYSGSKPSIADQSLPLQVYHELMDKNGAFRLAVTDYILQSRYKMRDQFEYANREAYIKERKSTAIQAYYNDMDGRPVFCKSEEECKICDYLGARGVKFRYEESYEYNVQDQDHKQYKPDFSIYFKDSQGVDHRVYLEHYAVNGHGHCPAWFGDGTELSQLVEEKKYLNGIEWKRGLHKLKGTKLIETRSAYFHDGTIFNKLDAQLRECGLTKYSFEHSREDISREIAKQEQNILDTLTAFTFLLKSKGISPENLHLLNIQRFDIPVIQNIVAPYIKAYESKNKENGEIDFVDSIIEATKLCKNGLKHEYDYILVDEFQDISLDRYRFLQSLRRDKPLTKLFCVGDDWQSIYRFAGSDMALFKDFSKYFGYTKECRMETTYRFGEPLIKESSDFILHNPNQKTKAVKSFKKNADTRLNFIGVIDRNDTIRKVINIIDSIPQGEEIYILGRYSFNINIFANSPIIAKSTANKILLEYNGRMMTYMTIHQSKGLECDYVILLGCDSGTMGFPAEISDSPILKYVLSEPDDYEFGEERRVFYVGITRAKKISYVLYNLKNPSKFVTEFVDIDIKNKNEAEYIPIEERCPRCKCGRIVERARGKAVNGNPYKVYVCSNERFGCDYKETKFVNLNHKKTTSSYR